MSEPDLGTGSGSETPDGVQVVNAVDAVRRHPEWFFRSGRYDLDELIAHLVEEAWRGGAGAVHVQRNGDWISVAADTDWLDGDVAAFFAPLSYGAGGRNSTRVEVAITAFSDAVMTSVDGRTFSVVTSTTEAAPIQQFSAPVERVVAFLPPAEARHELTDRLAGSSTRLRLRLVQGEGEADIVSAVHSFVRKVEHG